MINDVYRVTQIILNKNDRGVITPDRFNDLANSAQLKIFSELPNDIRLAQFRKNTGRDAMSINYLRDTLDKLNETVKIMRSEISPYYFNIPDDCVKINEVYNLSRIADRVDYGKMEMYNDTIKPNEDFPIYALRGSSIFLRPDTIGLITVNYQRTPKTPKWTYIVAGGSSIFNDNDPTFQDFELGVNFFNRIVLELLTSVGLHLKEQEVIQVSQQDQESDFRKENM